MPNIRTSLIIIALAMAQLPAINATHAAVVTNYCQGQFEEPSDIICSYPSQEFLEADNDEDRECLDIQKVYYVNGPNCIGINNCNKCGPKYTQKQVTFVDTTTSYSCGTITYYICERKDEPIPPDPCEGKTCNNCVSDKTFISIGGGKQQKQTRECKCGICEVTQTQYQCDKGYYGNGTTCTTCPVSGTSNAGSTKIQDCYATTFRDSKGSGKYENPCYHK